MLSLGASGVQMGTRFLGTKECDAKAYQQILPHITEDDIELVKSPVGYPARALNIGVMQRLKEGNAPKVQCISNCVSPCQRGKEAKKVGYCIADSLGKGHLGNLEEGLYFSGANGYRVKEILSVKALVDELTKR